MRDPAALLRWDVRLWPFFAATLFGRPFFLLAIPEVYRFFLDLRRFFWRLVLPPPTFAPYFLAHFFASLGFVANSFRRCFALLNGILLGEEDNQKEDEEKCSDTDIHGLILPSRCNFITNIGVSRRYS